MITLNEFKEIEHENGRFIISAEVTEDGLKNIIFADFGPDDLFINVWNCRADLCRAVPTQFGFCDEPVKFDALTERLERILEAWLDKNIWDQGGAINMSGQYAVIYPLPPALKRKLAKGDAS